MTPATVTDAKPNEISLQEALLDALESANVGEQIENFALAAWDGPAALNAALAGDESRQPRRPNRAAAPASSGGRAYLQQIAVAGFRGIGPRAELNLNPAPGLTLVLGRNGSGKSSFAEGAEVLLTNDNMRWNGRPSEFAAGWKNLHAESDPCVSALFQRDGEVGNTALTRTWTGERTDDNTLQCRSAGQDTDLDTLGWTQNALTAYRPFLPYTELANWADQPSRLHDAVSSILGVERLEAVDKTLDDARKEHAKAKRALQPLQRQIIAKLEASDDPRAAAVRASILKTKVRTEEIAIILAEGADEIEDPALHSLQKLTRLRPLDRGVVTRVIDDLRTSDAAMLEAAVGSAEKSSQVATLLQQALKVYDSEPTGTCPVCQTEGVLSPKWRAEASGRATSLDDAARKFRQAKERRARALREADKTVRVEPTIDRDTLREALGDAEDADALLQALERYRAAATLWNEARAPIAASNASVAAEAMAATVDDYVEAAAALQSLAMSAVAARQNAWIKLSVDLQKWLDQVIAADRSTEIAKQLKAARDCVREAAATVRAARFEPIAEQARALWDVLHAESNVSLADMELTGSGNRRKLAMSIHVDDQPGAALGVMSQGELHALALSLFLPRASLDASPFGFMIIDDPVQSMDAARVDGLARALHQASLTRQVIVFTHDDRLAEAVTRLDIPAESIRVQRDPASRVYLGRARGPVETYLSDAMAVACDRNAQHTVLERVIPGLCRLALDAATNEALRRKRLGNGASHFEVDALIGQHRKLLSRVSLVLFDEDVPRRNNEVSRKISNHLSREHANVLFQANQGAHDGTVDGNPRRFVEAAREVARFLRNQ